MSLTQLPHDPVDALLSRLAALDIALRLEDGGLRFSAPRGALTAGLREEIARHKPALLARLQALAEADAAVTAAAAPDTGAPLSHGQRRLWFLDRLALEAGDTGAARAAYILPAALRLRGALQRPALARAVHALAVRHAVLRTVVEGDGEPLRQKVREDLWPTVLDTPLPAGVALQDHLASLACRPFDLAGDSPLRVHLVALGPLDHALLILVHHIAADGWSLGVMVDELSRLYAQAAGLAVAPLPPLPCQYADFARWQQQCLAGPALETLVAGWKSALAGVPATVELPLDLPRPAAQSMTGGHVHARVPASVVQALGEYARGQGATLFMALFAAYGWLLSRWLGEERFVLGTPVANRLQSRFEPLIGFFVNTLPLVVDCRDAPRFPQLLARVKEEAGAAFSRAELPFDLLVDRLGLPRDLARAPLVQHSFVLLNAPSGRLQLPGLDWEPIALETATAKYDLSLTLEPQADGGLHADFEYNSDILNADSMGPLVRQFTNLLAALARQPDSALTAALLWDAAWREQVLGRWSLADQPLPDAVPDLFELFEAHALARPDAPALVDAASGRNVGWRARHGRP